MLTLLAAFSYFIIFLAIYVQVFFLITFIENRKRIIRREGKTDLARCSAVTITVPCFNEEKTVVGTINSLLGLDYPKDKLHIFIVDDGSTDKTWKVVQQFKNHPGIRLFTKPNGGKHTAQNLALVHATTDFVGCLDADSFVDPQALKRIMTYFLNPEVMAVAPTIIVYKPKTFVQYAQKAEYEMAVYIKKMLGFLGAIHVTPGPFSIFRKKVFENLGNYRKAHNTEDMEIAYRMQENGYKIEQCNDAYVYTVAPDSVKKLYTQRVRWISGFLNNTLDYRRLIFKPKYGNFAFFTVPSGIISIFAAFYIFGNGLHGIINKISEKFVQVSAVGVSSIFSFPRFDWFFFNTQASAFLSVLLFSLLIFSMVLGSRMTHGKIKFSRNIFILIAIYAVVAPFWLFRAAYNTAFSKTTAWR